MHLKELLLGFTAHQPQSVGNMTIIPLTAPDTEYQDVGNVDQIFLDQDTSYNSLHLGSKAGCVTIVPNGLTYLTKEYAQDRAIPRAHLIKKPKKVSAFCVQSSQSGHMHKAKKESRQLRLLPQSLRYKAYQKRDSTSYSELWRTLGDYNRSAGVTGDFLSTYFEKYANQLDQFVAEFEVIPGQRGAIILINDEIAGIEVAPNAKAFEAMWEPSIRDCYGSEALRARDKAKPTEVEILEDITDLADLATIVDRLEQREKAFAKDIVMTVLEQSGKKTLSHQLEELAMYEVETTGYVGFGVETKDGDEGFIFLSLISKPLAQRDLAFN